MSSLKLVVEVVRGNNLIGQGSSSPFVELHFDGQKYRTTIKERDLNPSWDEVFYLEISDPNSIHGKMLEAHIYNSIQGFHSKSSMGKVKISGSSFVSQSDAVVFNYPLEKAGFFSSARGELGLKVYLSDDHSIKPSVPVNEMDSLLPQSELASQNAEEGKESVNNEKKGGLRRVFYHLPNISSKQKQPHSVVSPDLAKSDADGTRFKPRAEKLIRMLSGSFNPADFLLKETNPLLGGGPVKRSDKLSHLYDLVEPMLFLFVRVVKAKDLSSKDHTGVPDPFVEVRVGNYKGVTKHFEKNPDPEWNSVFTFSKERIQTSHLEIVVKDKNMLKDDIIGIVRLDPHDIPTRVPPDSPLAPEWYLFETKKGKKDKGEIMLAVWIGTQGDEAFADAWHSDAADLVDSSVTATHIRSKIYHSPRLWYVLVNVIEAQDLVVDDKNRVPNLHVKAQIGSQVMKTRPLQSHHPIKALWNEEFMFVTAEPFDDQLVLSVEDHVSPNKDEILGRVFIPLSIVDRRADNRVVYSRWFSLQEPSKTDVVETKKDMYASRIHVRVCLDGGYHVLDESTHYSSDLRPSAKQLWKPPIGRLDVGILNANALTPMKVVNGRGSSDTFCVAKYGQKWTRTRTIVDSLNPKYNEQYSWEVFDPATVLTVGVFDNGKTSSKTADSNRDMRIGKVRIRISTLESGRIYTHSYPLLVLHPTGVKKMGELHLAIRFSCTSMLDMMCLYSRPLLPKMHYVRPLTMAQLDQLRHQAVSMVAAKLSRAEPPLHREVVEYMTDADSHLWSMRRSRANFYRLMSVFNGLLSVGKWIKEVSSWKNPATTVLVQFLFIVLMCLPELILPTVFIYMFLVGLWNYWFRPRHPPHMDIKLSLADSVHPDELAEEFETFPATSDSDIIRMRYDRLRVIGGQIQKVVGDIASQGERIQAILSWRDPRATVIFMGFCIAAATILYVVPFKLLIIVCGLYLMRHPMFRHMLPPILLNFFRRLPTRTDTML